MSLTGTVLLVDDDPDALHAHAEMLRRHEGLHILTATDGPHGLEAARIHRPDVILSDLMMPGMTGIELCQAVRADATLRGVLFLLLTGVENAHGEVGTETLVDDRVIKPVTADELNSKVASMLRLKRAHDELRADKLELERLHVAMGERFDQLLSLLMHLMDLSVPGSAVRGAETARLASRLAQRFEIPSVLLPDLDIGARLHEIGKMLLRAERADAEVPEDVIEADAWRYAAAAKELFERTEGLESAAELIGAIYENWDGTGQPGRLRQGQIPLRSRILRLVIDYQALLQSDLVAAPNVGVEAIQHHAGTRYDPLAVAYLDAIVRASSKSDWRESRVRLAVSNLEEGMILAEDLWTSSGVKLLAKGAVLSTSTLDTILRRHRSDPIVPGAWIERPRE